MKLFFIPRLPEDKRRHAGTGITLVEVLLTVSVLGLIMAAMVPFIRTVHATWNLGDRKIELQQNARVGLDTISRITRQAARIINIPDTGRGNFIKLKDALDNQAIIFYHNKPGSPYYSGNSGLIKENDLVMATVDSNPTSTPIINPALLAKSLSNFELYFKDKNGQLTGQPKNVSYIDISMRLSDSENLIPDAIDITSSISIRSEVRMKPVWVATANFVAELSTDNWIAGFSNPSSLSVNTASGECWVADTGNNSIKKLSSTGTVLLNLGGFSQPRSVSVNPNSGECWVADTGNNSIKKLSSTGTVLLNLGGFSQPRSVSVNPNSGECWVADTGNSRIIKLSAGGSILANVADFWQPNCVSVNFNTGECWVADTNKDRVRKISAGGTVLLTRSGFKNPMTVSVYPASGECWVADTGNSRVKKLSPDKGTFSLNLAGFNRPLCVAVDYATGDCWVADTNNNQVVKLDAEGNEEFRLSNFPSPSAISISPDE
jgi:DNA-binding beta-propeller fold protein YncE